MAKAPALSNAKPQAAVLNPTMLLAISSFLLFSLNLVLALSTAAWAGPRAWLLFGLQTFLIYLLFTPMHEAVHRSASSKRWINEWTLIITGICFISDGRLFRRIHLAHHAYTNRGSRDPDHFTASSSLAMRWLKSFALIGSYYHHVATKFRRDVPRRQMLVSLLAPVVVLALAVYFDRLSAMLVAWVAPWFVAQGILGFTFTSLPHHPASDVSRHGNSRLMLAPQAFQWLMLGQNLHLVHHYKPDVPWYHYEAYWLEHGRTMVAEGAKVERVLAFFGRGRLLEFD